MPACLRVLAVLVTGVVIAVVAGDLVFEQDVFPDGAVAVVVNDPHFAAPFIGAGDDDADVGGAVGESPDDDVAPAEVVHVGAVFRDWDALAVAGEEALEVFDTAVVDIGVGFFGCPELGVDAEVFFHVLVDTLLEVDSEGAVASDDDVGIGSFVGGDIAAGVGDFVVGGVVFDVVVGTFESDCGELVAESVADTEPGDGLFDFEFGNRLCLGEEFADEWAGDVADAGDDEQDHEPAAPPGFPGWFFRTRSDVFDGFEVVPVIGPAAHSYGLGIRRVQGGA